MNEEQKSNTEFIQTTLASTAREEIGKCYLCEGEVMITIYDPPKPIKGGWLLDIYDCDVCNIEQEHCIKFTKDLED